MNNNDTIMLFSFHLSGLLMCLCEMPSLETHSTKRRD